jgi:hypothetical protein
VSISRNAAPGLALGLMLVTSASPALAGAWTLEAGTGQAIVTGTLSSADHAFDSARSQHPAPRYNKFELQGLIEYGASDRLTVILSPMLQHVDIAAPVDAQRTGLGYTEAGARYQMLKGADWVLSGQATMRLPGTGEGTNPAAIGYTGAEGDIRALFGYSFSAGGLPAFLDVQVAQRFRSAGAPDEFRADFTLGLRPAPQWLLLAQSFNVISEGGGSPLFPSYDYYKLQASAVYSVTAAFSLQAGAFTTYTGRHALQENGVVLGAWYRF